MFYGCKEYEVSRSTESNDSSATTNLVASVCYLVVTS